jgi:hypothetical protein
MAQVVEHLPSKQYHKKKKKGKGIRAYSSKISFGELRGDWRGRVGVTEVQCAQEDYG